MNVDYRETRFKGLRAVELENELLKLIVLPDCGGEIVSFIYKPTGYDSAFYKADRVKARRYAEPYLKSAAGFDELFPNIGGGPCPSHPLQGVPMPDKGELWTRKLATEPIDGGLRQYCRGVRFPYYFERIITLNGASVEFDYSVGNLTEIPFEYQWSVQPHFNLYEGDRIEAPEGTSFYVDFSFNSTVNNNQIKHKWPLAKVNETEVDMSLLHFENDGAKLYLTDFPQKTVSVISPSRKMRTTYKFTGVDHCGIWIDKNIWPDDDPDTLIAVGPANCLSDSFEESINKNAIGKIQAGDHDDWHFSIGFEEF